MEAFGNGIELSPTVRCVWRDLEKLHVTIWSWQLGFGPCCQFFLDMKSASSISTSLGMEAVKCGFFNSVDSIKK